MEKEIPIKSCYYFDKWLMYLIQETTKMSTADIMAFFSDLSAAVINLGVQKAAKKNSTYRPVAGMRKDIRDFFPGTSIPFKMLIKGHSYTQRFYSGNGPHVTNVENNVYYKCEVEVGFPESREYLTEEYMKNLTEAMLEHSLLGGTPVSLPAFEKPKSKTPKLYVKLMQSVAKQTAKS
jgi:hypothetical protein